MTSKIENLACMLFRDQYVQMENLSDGEVREIALRTLRAASIYYDEFDKMCEHCKPTDAAQMSDESGHSTNRKRLHGHVSVWGVS